MSVYRPVIWTAELRDAALAVATEHSSQDVRSRASEIARGARVGETLTPMNCEFIAALRSRFSGSGSIIARETEQAFDARWGTAWEAAGEPTLRPVVWTAELAAACREIADLHMNPSLQMRASEIANGAVIGSTLTPMNVEFVSALRSRFGGMDSDEPPIRAAERAFDAAWGDAWEAAGEPTPSRDDVRKETADELSHAAFDGTWAAFAGDPETVCPFATDTAQGIVWTQAFRLTLDRIGDLVPEIAA